MQRAWIGNQFPILPLISLCIKVLWTLQIEQRYWRDPNNWSICIHLGDCQD